jgi:hypothetical protein
MEASPSPLSSRPKRTRISCHAAPDKAACAPFFKERRMMFANATNFYRKSGAAQRRDLCVDAPSWRCFSTELPWACGPPKVMKNASVQQLLSIEPLPFPFVIPSEAEGSAVPRTFPGNVFSTERTRISCHAALDRAACAPFFKERRIWATPSHQHPNWREDCRSRIRTAADSPR